MITSLILKTCQLAGSGQTAEIIQGRLPAAGVAHLLREEKERKTFYIWQKRFDGRNLRLLESGATAPHVRRRKTITLTEEERVVALRRQHIRWGKLKLARLYCPSPSITWLRHPLGVLLENCPSVTEVPVSYRLLTMALRYAKKSLVETFFSCVLFSNV